MSLSSAELRGEIARRLESWRADARAASGDGEPAVAAVDAEATGWIAMLEDGRLLALDSCAEGTMAPAEDPATIARALAVADGRARREHPSEREWALGALTVWLTREWTHRSAGLAVSDTPLRRRVLRSIEVGLRAAPRHRRPALGERAAAVRRGLARSLPLGVERALDALVRGDTSRWEWIADAASIIDRVPARSSDDAMSGPPIVRGLILLGPAASARDAPSAR